MVPVVKFFREHHDVLSIFFGDNNYIPRRLRFHSLLVDLATNLSLALVLSEDLDANDSGRFISTSGWRIFIQLYLHSLVIKMAFRRVSRKVQILERTYEFKGTQYRQSKNVDTIKNIHFEIDNPLGQWRDGRRYRTQLAKRLLVADLLPVVYEVAAIFVAIGYVMIVGDRCNHCSVYQFIWVWSSYQLLTQPIVHPLQLWLTWTIGAILYKCSVVDISLAGNQESFAEKTIHQPRLQHHHRERFSTHLAFWVTMLGPGVGMAIGLSLSVATFYSASLDAEGFSLLDVMIFGAGLGCIVGVVVGGIGWRVLHLRREGGSQTIAQLQRRRTLTPPAEALTSSNGPPLGELYKYPPIVMRQSHRRFSKQSLVLAAGHLLETMGRSSKFKIEMHAVNMQRLYRAGHTRRCYLRMRAAVVRIQAAVRGWLVRRLVLHGSPRVKAPSRRQAQHAGPRFSATEIPPTIYESRPPISPAVVSAVGVSEKPHKLQQRVKVGSLAMAPEVQIHKPGWGTINSEMLERVWAERHSRERGSTSAASEVSRPSTTIFSDTDRAETCSVSSSSSQYTLQAKINPLFDT